MALRRRSPQWVRELTSRECHGIALKLHRGRTSADLSDAQEWLWEAVISELEYRWRHPSTEWFWCSCELCCPPFPEYVSDEAGGAG